MTMRRRQFLTCLTQAAGASIAGSVCTQPQSGKIIEFGWGTPPPLYIRAHIQAMEQLPFDGLVLDLKANTGPTDSSSYFSFKVWGSQVLQAADYSESIDALQHTQFSRFTENFLRFTIVPGNIDWYDEGFHAVIANARLTARLAKQSHLVGIFFDVEHYQGKLFSYAAQPQRQQHSFTAYQQQVRQRGRELMLALEAEYAAITILLSYGYSLACQSGKPLDTASYGLLPAFLDGMLEGATPGMRMFDGWEASYGYQTEQQFQNASNFMRRDSLKCSRVEQKFEQHYRASFGLWVDYRGIWNATDFTHNYFPPTAFEQAVRLALQYTDRYVWIYSQKPHWWDGTMPRPYIDALTKARRLH